MTQYSIGMGITNECNYSCKHCYSRPKDGKFSRLSFDMIKRLCKSLDVYSINFGTGESILHPDFKKIIKFLHDNKIKISLTTNGLSVSKLSDGELKFFNDIDFSLDFPMNNVHDLFRGKGAFESVMAGIDRCKALGVECSIVVAVMKTNYRYIPELLLIAAEKGVNLRVNIYKPKNEKSLKLSYREFWTAIKLLFDNSKIISCSEPIVNALIKHKVCGGGSPCGKKSLRVRPDGGIVPCVYWDEYDLTLEDLKKRDSSLRKSRMFDKARTVPEECRDCELFEYCKGGCSARRLYNNINKKDEYCFISRKKPELNVEWAKKKDLVHSSYLCTIIVEPKKGGTKNERR